MQRNLHHLARVFALILCWATALPAQDAARFAPAGAVAYVQIDGLASLRKDWEKDPLATYIKENLPLPPQQGWDDLQKVMGLSEQEIIDKFLGQTITLIAFESGQNPPLMIVSKVAQADADLAIEKMQLKATGMLGQWKGYSSTDNKATIVVGGGWVIVVDKRIGDAVKPVLEGKGKTLADDPAFVQWIDRLPKSRSVTAFMREGDTITVRATSPKTFFRDFGALAVRERKRRAHAPRRNIARPKNRSSRPATVNRSIACSPARSSGGISRPSSALRWWRSWARCPETSFTPRRATTRRSSAWRCDCATPRSAMT